MPKLKVFVGLATVLIALGLNGCWNDDDNKSDSAKLDDNKSDSAKLTGTAATGAPIIGGNVDIKCAEGSPLTAITNENGVWEVNISGQVFPCALAVTGGNLDGNESFYSLALGIGNINITPLTNLVVANLVGQNPKEWFDSLNVASLTTVNQTALDNSLDSIATELGLTTALNDLNPFTVAFNAVTGDRFDNILQAMANVVSAVLTNYDQLLNWAAYPGTFNLPVSFSTEFNTAFNTITNGGDSGTDNGNTGTVTLLSCNTDLFAANTVHQATAEELQGFDGSYTGQIHTFDANGNSTPSDAIVGYHSSNGVITIDSTAKVITSACVDNQVGEKGAMLYLHFADGHVDLFGDNTFSGSLDANTNSGTDTGENGGGTDTGNTETDTGNTPTGTANLTVGVTASGVLAPAIEVSGVPEPTTEAEFCGEIENDETFTNIGTQGGGTLILNSCSFANRVGNISATLSITSPISMTLPYTVTYTYHD